MVEAAIMFLLISSVMLLTTENVQVNTPFSLWIFILIITEAITAFLSPLPEISLIYFKQMLFLLLLSSIMSFFRHQYAFTSNAVLWIFLLCGIFVGIKMLWDYNLFMKNIMLLGKYDFSSFRQYFRPFGVNINISSTFLVPGLLFSYYLYIKTNKIETALFSGTAFIIFTKAIYCSRARALIISAALGVVITLAYFLSKRLQNNNNFFKRNILIFIVLVIVFIIAGNLESSFLSRLTIYEKSGEIDGSIKGRLDTWRAIVNEINVITIVGSGQGTYPFFRDRHFGGGAIKYARMPYNFMLLKLVENGWIGFFVYISFFSWLFFRGVKKIFSYQQPPNIRDIFFITIIILLFRDQFYNSLSNNFIAPWFWILIGVTASFPKEGPALLDIKKQSVQTII